MKIFKEYTQGQIFLLRPSLGEFVPKNHEARIINEVVETTDLSPLLARYEGGAAPAYHPAMMLKVVICAYGRGIYSSRSIARELKTDSAFMFLSGIQVPDFRAICLSRAEHADVLLNFYVRVARLCASLGTVGLGWGKSPLMPPCKGKCFGETDQRQRWLGEGDRAHQGGGHLYAG